MQVLVVNPRGQGFRIEVRIFDKVLTMKQKIEKSQGIPVSKQTLSLYGKVLRDNLDTIQCQIHANSVILLTVSPDYNPNQNNDQGLQTQQSPAAPSNPIDEFVNNPGWPAMGINDQVLQTEKPDKTLESVEKFLGIQDWPATVEGESYQVRHQNQQSAVSSDSIFGEDLALTTEHISNIQNYWSAATTQEEILGIQDLPPVKVGSNTNQVTETEKPSPSDSVKEIIDITDSPVKKKIKLSPMKLTVMVKPFMETREIPVEVNAGDKVKVLKHELVKMQQRGELDLPKEGYFFIHKQDVLDENWSFRLNGVAHYDKIEIFRGAVTYGGGSTTTRVQTRAS